jgi:hypothetical protein
MNVAETSLTELDSYQPCVDESLLAPNGPPVLIRIRDPKVQHDWLEPRTGYSQK